MSFRVPEGRFARRVLAWGAGLAICFSMPPWGWWPLAIVGIALWALLVDSPRWQRRFWVGAMVGAGWFLPSTLWMFKFSLVGWPIGVLVWFPLICGAASALCPAGPARLAALPATLILSEWLRWHAPFGGVPLSMLAMTQARGPLLPVARVGGSLLVSAAVAAAGAILAAMVERRWKGATGALAVLVAVAAFGVVAPSGHDVRTIRVAAVQGGGPQETRSASTDYSVVFDRHLRASDRIHRPVDLVVWPENVVNVATYDGSYEQSQLRRLAESLDATLVAGIVENGADDEHFLNAAEVLGPNGRELGRYEKVRRVPFGEYVPMRFLLDPVAKSVLPPRDQVPGTKPNIVATPAGRLGIVVSWEVFFGRRVRESIHHDAEIVLNPTNGSSYWLTQVQTQQVASSTLRAVESGRWLVQAAPTGFSAIIDPAGDVVMRSALGRSATLEHRVALRQGNTIAAVTGDLFALVLAAILLIAAWWTTRRGPRREGLPITGRAVPDDRHGTTTT